MLTLRLLCEQLMKFNEQKVGIALIDVLAKYAATYEEFTQVGECYNVLKEHKKSVVYAEKALSCTQIQENVYFSKYNLVNAYASANYPEKALRMYSQIEEVFSDDVDLLMSKSFALFLNNQKNEAESLLRSLLERKDLTEKQRTGIIFNLGTYEMMRDEFLPGLKKFLFEGRKMDVWKKPQLRFDRWEGDVVKNKKIIMLAEAGLGDEFVNFRFMKTIKDLGMKPIWFSTNKQTTQIFKRMGYDVINNMDYIKYDESEVLWTHTMDIPVYLNMEYKDLWYGPYISADSRVVSPVKKNDRLKIGIRWQGNPLYDQDLHRTLPLKEIYQAVKHIDADFYSLQKEDGFDQFDDFPGLIDISEDLKDFEVTLKAIDDLDFIITSCTSVAHAAAAMGKKTYVFTPISHYYTWCHTLKYSPWYGEHVEILRQVKPRSWKEPISELKKLLEIYKK
jgi:hypothetical protein